MRKRRLGRTELCVSELSLGTVELGLAYGIAPQANASGKTPAGLPPPSPAEATRLLQQALAAGINFIDTARAYGTSEQVIGQALRGHRHEVYITTKVGCLDREGMALQGEALRQQMRQSITTSLRHLQTDRVDILMLHTAPVPVLQAGEAVTVLKELQTEGLTRYIGASTYGAEAARLALEQCELDVLQVAYNVLDQRMANDIFPLAQQKDVGLVVRSVYLKGVLTERAEDLPERLEPLKERSRIFRQLAARLTPPLPAAQTALRFVLSRPDIATVLVGVRSEQELAAATAAAAAGPLTPETMSQLEALHWDDPVWLNPSNWGIP